MEYVMKNPEITKIQIRRPIFVLSPARCGSTLTFNLLAQDPRTRAPLPWEMGVSVPTVTPPPTGPKDPRAKLANEQFAKVDLVMPEFASGIRASHNFNMSWPEECYFVFLHQLDQAVNGAAFEDLEFYDWTLSDKNREFLYKYHLRYLQMLSSGYAPESHWTMKSPLHAGYIETLTKFYPDAFFVVAHRSPPPLLPNFRQRFAHLVTSNSEIRLNWLARLQNWSSFRWLTSRRRTLSRKG